MVSQPASARNAQSESAGKLRILFWSGDSLKYGFMKMDGFLLLLLEAGVALALLLFIVWWTWPRGKSRDGEDGGPDRR